MDLTEDANIDIAHRFPGFTSASNRNVSRRRRDNEDVHIRLRNRQTSLHSHRELPFETELPKSTKENVSIPASINIQQFYSTISSHLFFLIFHILIQTILRGFLSFSMKYTLILSVCLTEFLAPC